MPRPAEYPAEPKDPTEAITQAYERVATGFLEALEITGLPLEERARLVRCHRHALRKAGHHPPVHLQEAQRDLPPAETRRVPA